MKNVRPSFGNHLLVLVRIDTALAVRKALPQRVVENVKYESVHSVFNSSHEKLSCVGVTGKVPAFKVRSICVRNISANPSALDK